MTAELLLLNDHPVIVDQDVAAAYSGAWTWRRLAGRVLAIVDNVFYDLAELIGGQGTEPGKDPLDYRRKSLVRPRLEVWRTVESVPWTYRSVPTDHPITMPPVPSPAPPCAPPLVLEPDGLAFIGYESAHRHANVAADSIPNAATVLSLSHWPNNDTPPEYRADLSGESAFLWLDRADPGLLAKGVTSEHFDVDGVITMFPLMAPQLAAKHRSALIDMARCGDFSVCEDIETLRRTAALRSVSHPHNGMLPFDVFRAGVSTRRDIFFRTALRLLPTLLAHPQKFSRYWQADEHLWRRTEHAFETGAIAMTEDLELDLATFDLSLAPPAIPKKRLVLPQYLGWSALSFHARTNCKNILLRRGTTCEVHQRYEGWVRLTRPPQRTRQNLSVLADALTQLESDDCRWVYDGLSHITPCLRPQVGTNTSLSPESVTEVTKCFLASAPPGWRP